jgi:hypothetical protein
MDWIIALTAPQIAALVAGILVLLGGLAAMLTLAKNLGLSVTKEGLKFRANEKTDSILGIVREIKESDGRQELEIKRLGDEVNKNTKDTLRLTFYNQLLPPEDRLVAGKRYLDAGGNGPTEKAINAYAGQYPDVWRGILAVRKEA